MALTGRSRKSSVHRREARRGQRRHVSERQPGDRGSAGCRGRRGRGRHGCGDRRSPQAFDETDWSTNVELRARCIRQLQQAMRDHVEELRDITVSEVGAPVMLTAGAQLEGPIEDLSFVRRHRRVLRVECQDLGHATPQGIPTNRTMAREAVGVVGAITPWNFRTRSTWPRLVPPLAAGNTLVLKPAPDTRGAAAVLGELIAGHTDIPPGVINIVTSSDHGVGALLSKDPRVDMVSFTGSTNAGRSVMVDAAATIKKVFLELGGKSAFLVLDDADLAGASLDVGIHRVITPGRAARSPPGWWCRGPLRRGGRRRRNDGLNQAGRPDEPTNRLRARSFPRVSATACTPMSIWRSPRKAGSPAAVAAPAERKSGFYVSPTVFAEVDNNARVSQRGDLRPGARCHSPTTATTTPSASPTTRRTACRAQCSALNLSAGGRGRGADPGRHHQGQRRRLVLRRAPFGGYKQSGTAARWAWPASRSTWKPNHCDGRLTVED